MTALRGRAYSAQPTCRKNDRMAIDCNPFLQGNYAPIDSEFTRYDLPVRGQIPLALRGRYLRTGPNPVHVADHATHHWFMGNGMVHGIELCEGKAIWYKARWVASRDMARRVESEALRGAANGAAGMGNASIFCHAGRIYAVDEMSVPYELDKSLATLRREDFGGALTIGMNAHPKLEADTGILHTLAYDLERPFLRYQAFGPRGEALACAAIELPKAVMVHEFLITANYIVLFDLPVVLDMELAWTGRALPFRWNAQHHARLGVAPRTSPGMVEWFDIPPCYVLHAFNAYEERQQIVIDLVRHPRMFDTCLTGPGDGHPRVERWCIDLQSHRVIQDIVDERPQEFPRINGLLTGRRHRFGYSVACGVTRGGQTHFASCELVKHDFDKRRCETIKLPAELEASEFTFVAAPRGRHRQSEDDGWLVGYAYNRATDASELLILSASDPRAAPLASIGLPRRVPFGFHGAWINDSELEVLNAP